MVSTFTTNLKLELQGTGDHSGTWGGSLNTAVFTILDTVLGGAQAFTLSNVDVTVTTTQSQNNAILLSGTLTGNVNIIFPSIGKTYYVANNTSGAFSVTLKTASAGVTQVIPQGASGYYTLNVTDVLVPTLPGVPVGAVMAFAQQTAPTGWQECDGSAISRSTFAALFTAIGTTYGVGNGSTTFNIPDTRGYFLRGWDHGRGIDSGRAFGSNQSSDNLAHNHSFTGNALPGHDHTFPVVSNDAPTGNAADGSGGGTATVTVSSTSAGTPSGTIGSSGGTESRPYNIAMLICIRVS